MVGKIFTNRRVKTVVILATFGAVALLSPVVASAPCDEGGFSFANEVGLEEDQGPKPCKASQVISPQNQNRFGAYTATGCPGSCGYCGCGGGGIAI